MKKTVVNEAITHCYRELYKYATPPADFDKLVEEAPLDEHGKKNINYMAYEIEEKLMEKIINNTLKKFKITSPYMARKFRQVMYLGASPKFKREIES